MVSGAIIPVISRPDSREDRSPNEFRPPMLKPEPLQVSAEAVEMILLFQIDGRLNSEHSTSIMIYELRIGD